jgi:hypothetical protein
MTDRSLYLDLVRELPKGDVDSYREKCARLDEAGWEELALVLGAAFFLAARQRFGSDAGKEAIISFVAGKRMEMSQTGFDIDPVVSERLLASAMDRSTDELEDVDSNTVIETQLFLLTGLLAGLSDEEMASYLSEVDGLVHEWQTTD